MAGSSVALSAGLFVGGLAVGASGAALLSRQRSERELAPVIAEKEPPSAPIDSPHDGAVLIGGNPGPVADFLRHVAYISSYDRARRHPHWTAEHLTAASLLPPADGAPRGDRRSSVFREDERIKPEMFRSRNVDYFRSGYDRGHMVPAADCKLSQQSMNETFYLTNIAPQVGEGFNRDYWAHVEDFVRRTTAKFSDLYVFTIPLYLPRQGGDGKWRVTYEVIGDPPNVSVPTHFAKVLYGVGSPNAANSSSRQSPSGGATQSGLLSSVGLRPGQTYAALGAFVLPNAVIPNEAPLRSFVVPVDAVEKAAGLQLFAPALKSGARALCDAIDCNIIVRDFGDRNTQQRKSPTPSLQAAAPATSPIR